MTTRIARACYGNVTIVHASARVVRTGNSAMMARHNPIKREPMSAEQDTGQLAIPEPQAEEPKSETLTDFIDRMDREAFRRALAQRDLRMLATRLRPER